MASSRSVTQGLWDRIDRGLDRAKQRIAPHLVSIGERWRPDEEGETEVADDASSADRSAATVAPPEVPPELAPEPEPTGFGRVVAVAKEAMQRNKSQNITVQAAGIAFYALLAIPAALFATIAIAGLVIDPDTIEEQITENLSDLPEDVQSIIGTQLESIATSNSGGLVISAIVGILLAVWSVSGGVTKLLSTLNVIYEVDESRKFLKLRGLAIALTFGAVVLVVSAGFLLAVLPSLLDDAGLGSASRVTFDVLRFPFLIVVMIGGLTVLYWVGPDRERPFRFVSWGAIVAALLWLIASGLFTIFTANFANYNETYATIGGVVVLLMWLWITSLTVLLGAVIDAVLHPDETGAAPATPARPG